MVGKNHLEHVHAGAFELLTPSSAELALLDAQNVRNYLSEHKPKMIIHAAGVVGGIQANIANPVRFLVDNMQMGLNILMSAKNLGIKNFMNLSSSCMFPKDAKNPLTEELILKGELEPTNEGYALAKVATTRLCEYITKEDDLCLYKTVIPCNLYGRHDKFDSKYSHMIPGVIQKLAKAKKQQLKEIDIWGDGLARREFMYSGDFADFIFYALQNFDKMPQNINVGLGHDYTINEYYSEIAKVVGFNGEFVHDLTKPIGMKQKLIDNTKLQRFGWKHTTKLQEGLEATYQYFKEKS